MGAHERLIARLIVVAIACSAGWLRGCGEGVRADDASTRTGAKVLPPIAYDPRGRDDRPSALEAYFDVHGNTLSTPRHGHIPLGRGHASVNARTRIRSSPSGARVVVETNLGACGPSARHVVDLVELETRSVRRVDEGAGWVRTSFRAEIPQVEPRACD